MGVGPEALTMEERREAIVDALRETRGNKSEAAEEVGNQSLHDSS